MRNGWRTVLRLLSVWFLSACSILGPRISNIPAGLEFPLVETQRVPYEGKVIPPVRASGGKIYLATDRGILYCVDKDGKSVLWQFAASSPFAGAPAVGEDRLWVCDRAGTLYGLDFEGRLLMKAEIGAPVSSPLVLNQGRVYFGTAGGDLMAFDPDRQSLSRIFQTTGPVETPPAFSGRTILFAGGDGRLYALDVLGRILRKSGVIGRISVSPCVDNGLVYCGTDDRFFYCLNLADLERKWRIRIGGKLVLSPRAFGRHIIFIASNNVLYAVAKKSGNIDWWKILPGRGRFELEGDRNQIIAATQSSLLAAFRATTGEEIGRYDAGREVQSNALWLDTYLLINVHDPDEGKGQLIFLEKEVRADLIPSLSSPQPLGTEIAFSVVAVGFRRPRYEFFLRNPEGEERVVQKESAQNSWVWYPEKAGIYRIEVRVSDGRQERRTGTDFEIVERSLLTAIPAWKEMSE